MKIERLAAQLKIARSGFYWHFKNRQELLDQMLDYWVHEYTGVVAENPELSKLAPEDRLLRIMKMIDQYNLARFDVPMRAWAEHDQKAREVVEEVFSIRLNYLQGVFGELGFEGEELEMRARLFVCYHSWEKTTFGTGSSTKEARLRKLRRDLLIAR